MIRIFNPVLPDINSIKNCMNELWETGHLTNFGKYSKLFESKVKEYTKSPYVSAVSNCDTALKLCVSALKMSNKKVGMPTFTFNSTYMAASWNSCRISLLDINPKTLLVDLETLESEAKNGIENFILINTFGNMYNIDDINFLKKKYGLTILFDSAHSFGSTYKGTKSGNLGYTECYSFSATKIITSAEGGIICTPDKALQEQIRYSRNYGFSNGYNSKFLGCNAKISELHSIIGSLSMDLLDSLLEKKYDIVADIKNGLKNKYEFQEITKGVGSTYKDFILLNVDIEEAGKKLDKHNIQWKRYFLPLHMQDYPREKSKIESAGFKNAEHVWNSSVCIPAHPRLTKEEINTICGSLCE